MMQLEISNNSCSVYSSRRIWSDQTGFFNREGKAIHAEVDDFFPNTTCSGKIKLFQYNTEKLHEIA